MKKRRRAPESRRITRRLNRNLSYIVRAVWGRSGGRRRAVFRRTSRGRALGEGIAAPCPLKSGRIATCHETSCFRPSAMPSMPRGRPISSPIRRSTPIAKFPSSNSARPGSIRKSPVRRRSRGGRFDPRDRTCGLAPSLAGRPRRTFPRLTEEGREFLQSGKRSSHGST
jgi:hypothetical protein